jgi:hypothetical protein
MPGEEAALGTSRRVSADGSPQLNAGDVMLGCAGALLAAVALALLVVAALDVGPAYRAEHGAGVKGSWVAVYFDDDGRGGYWRGEFRLPDGKVLLRSVELDGPGTSLHAGEVIAATYSGGALVYPQEDSSDWIVDLAIMAAAVVYLAFFLWFVTRRLQGRVKRRHEAEHVP